MDELDESQLEEVEEEIDIFKMQAKKNLNRNPVIKKKRIIGENEPNNFHRLNKKLYYSIDDGDLIQIVDLISRFLLYLIHFF